jgi:hypothetical protein
VSPCGDAPEIAFTRLRSYPIGGRNRFASLGVYRPVPSKEIWMKTRLAALFGALMLASASAFAFHCPADMKKIDEALAKNPKLSAEQMADVKKYRADGETLHKAGKHQESVDTLGKAMKILGI